MNDDQKFFVCIVAGENPEELMKPYNKQDKVDEYIVYKYKDAHVIKEKAIKVYEEILKQDILSSMQREYYQEEVDDLKDMSDDDAYFYLTAEYDYDDKNNAISTQNPNGKYSMFQKAKLFSVPFITLDGREVFQARKKDIDWSKMHLHGQEIYAKAWDMVMNHVQPSNDYEKNIYENMKNRTQYFQTFGTKENYIIHSTAFWGYAFLSDKDGWFELEDTMSEFDWVRNFYDNFIVPLDDNTLLTIFECKK